MIYIYNPKKLKFVRVKCFHIGLTLLFAVMLTITTLSIMAFNRPYKDPTESEVMVIMNKHNQFTKEKLICKIKELNFKFPHIVLGQALLETGNFHSKIFLENNNLFGMKQATQRLNIAKGNQYDHAYYSSWIDSVYDYALYCATYLSKFETEEDYLSFLSQSYAEDTNYVNKLKEIILRENLVSKFK